MVETPQNQPLTTRVILDEHSWDAIRNDWDALYAASPSASTPLDFRWLRGWWRVYGPVYGSGGLRIVTVWKASELVGALPLYEERGPGGSRWTRTLRFISTGEEEKEETCPDYMNLLYLPAHERACVELAWREISRMAWDQLELLDLPEDSPLVFAGSLPFEARPFSRGSCCVADLGDGLEAYIARLSPKARRNARRLLREGEREGLQFQLTTAEQSDEAFGDLVTLHQQRWTAGGQAGVFAAASFVQFHRELLRDWLPDGRVVLARLSKAEAPVAVVYGFVTKGRFEAYLQGAQRGKIGSVESPGILIHLLLMRAFTEQGVASYDFLRGSSFYKERLATRENALVGIRAWRRTPRAAAGRVIGLAGRVVRKVRRLAGSADR
jgi:CelD/BcsL family acetyltransferase involved in cellulose biosynthesis